MAKEKLGPEEDGAELVCVAEQPAVDGIRFSLKMDTQALRVRCSLHSLVRFFSLFGSTVVFTSQLLSSRHCRRSDCGRVLDEPRRVEQFPEPDSHVETERQTECRLNCTYWSVKESSRERELERCASGRRERLQKERAQAGEEPRGAQHTRAQSRVRLRLRLVSYSPPAPAVEWSGAHVVCRVRAHPAPDAARVQFELSARWLQAVSGADLLSTRAAADKGKRVEQEVEDGKKASGGGGKEGALGAGAGHRNLTLSAAGLERSLAAHGFRIALTPALLNVRYQTLIEFLI